MSFLDKLIGSVTPPESDETRLEARERARAETVPGDWLSLILDHHDAIDAAFTALRDAPDASGRITAQRQLALVLNGHSLAEEVVLYPEVAESGHKAHATLAYEEQSMAKVQMALLEKLDPMSQDYLDKIEHIRGAVTHHMYQEETSWFLDLKADVPGHRQAVMAERYREEFERYTSMASA